VCVLDFFVRKQRQGLGKLLFEETLEKENLRPEQLALDRPSEKFKAFMKKHYGLKNFRTQSNKFVVFDEFWNFTEQVPQNNSSKPRKETEQSALSEGNNSIGEGLKSRLLLPDFRRKKAVYY
jgi:alpha-tubulin N-acetyltransferase 1